MTHMVSLLLSSSDFHYTMHIYISDICTHHLISVADALRDSSYVPTDSYLKRPYARLMLFCAQYYHIVGILRKKSEGFMTHMVSLLLSSLDFHHTMHIYISDICTHHLISRFSTNSLLLQSSISYVEH